jgi:hypothetical protein
MLRIALLSLAMTGQAPADDADPTANDPRMLADYARVVAFLARVPDVTLEVRSAWETSGEDPPQRGVNRCRARFARDPDRFRIEVLGDGEGEGEGDEARPALIVASDGRATTVYHPGRKLYSRHEHGDLAEALGCQAIVGQSLSGMLVDTLFRPDLVAVVEDHAARGRFEGVETIDGRALNRYTLHWRGDDEVLWIGPDAEPLPRRLIRVLRAPLGDRKPVTLTTTSTLTWTLGGGGDGDAAAPFTIDLPADARRVDDLDAALALDPGEAPAPPRS